jgi:hypothetical protein
MQAREPETEVAATTPAGQSAADPFSDATAAQTPLPVRGLLGKAQESARGMVEAEDAFSLVREHFQRTEDPQAQAELAAEALGHVERQLTLTRERRHGLDSIEGKLWARRNRLERFLIATRGRAWWQARRNRAQPETLDALAGQPETV